MIIKSPMNALHNVANPYQGKDKRVLCLCSDGLPMGAILANTLHSKYNYNVRNAGVSDYALIPVTPALLEWADEIRQKTITLDIPNTYEYMNPTLQRIIIEQYEGAINEN